MASSSQKKAKIEKITWKSGEVVSENKKWDQVLKFMESNP